MANSLSSHIREGHEILINDSCYTVVRVTETLTTQTSTFVTGDSTYMLIEKHSTEYPNQQDNTETPHSDFDFPLTTFLVCSSAVVVMLIASIIAVCIYKMLYVY